MLRAVVTEASRDPELAASFYEAGKRSAGDLFERAVVRVLRAHKAAMPEDVRGASGRLQGMIEHFSLLPALLLGATSIETAQTRAIEAVQTWLAAHGIVESAEGD